MKSILSTKEEERTDIHELPGEKKLKFIPIDHSGCPRDQRGINILIQIALSLQEKNAGRRGGMSPMPLAGNARRRGVYSAGSLACRENACRTGRRGGSTVVAMSAREDHEKRRRREDFCSGRGASRKSLRRERNEKHERGGGRRRAGGNER